MDEEQSGLINAALARRDERVRRDERQRIGQLIRETVEACPEPRNEAAAESFLQMAEILER